MKDRPIWFDFDRWVEEQPAFRRSQFDVFKSGMLLHSGYTTIVMTHIINSQIGKMLTNDPILEYHNFLTHAHKTDLVIGVDDNAPQINIYSVLTEIYAAVPEYSGERGVLLSHLHKRLTMLLPEGMPWDTLTIAPMLFRSVYWQLLKTMRLAGSDKKLSAEKRKSEHAYSCFITSILVCIFHTGEFVLAPRLPGYHDHDKVNTFITMLISSPIYRVLAIFFISSFWLLVKHRSEGGFITENEHRKCPTRLEAEADEEFLNRLNLTFNTGFDFKMPENEPDRLAKEWEVFAVGLLRRGLLTPPEGFKLINRGGRPRKEVKRRSDALTMADDAELMPPPATKPKDSPKKPEKFVERQPEKPHPSPRVRKDARRSGKKDLLLPPPPVVPIRPPSPPKRVIPQAQDVGLCPPIYVMQKDLIDNLTDEVTNAVANAYGEIHRIYRLVKKDQEETNGKRKLTDDQKLVMNNFGRFGADPKPQEPEIDVVPKHKASPTKTRRWRRRY
ncbi:unnamed protein product [Caenorhabditis sp. 36 PRJEB53466]|nr:unnamed protein product [Caenorhabditis sp. 36 PRJEB53466]